MGAGKAGPQHGQTLDNVSWQLNPGEQSRHGLTS
jgi:hypothetical protein